MLLSIFILTTVYISLSCTFRVVPDLKNGYPAIPLHEYGDSVYYFETVLWDEFEKVREFCLYLNMDLVSIETEKENNFLYTTLDSLFEPNTYGVYPFWTSGSKQTGVWTWLSTGKEFSYTNWGSSDTTNFSCMIATFDRLDPSLYWFNCDCFDVNFIICEGSSYN